MSGLLEGVRVLDVGTRIAAPYCAGALGELGAEVIKIEEPGKGEYLRALGPLSDGYSLMWSVEGRGRKSITLDLRQERGQAMLRRLADEADVVCENFRPGTMEGWQLGPGDLGRHLVYVRISVFGQDGPSAMLPGVDLLGLAYGGLLGLTGLPGRTPVKSNVTISDHLTGVMASTAAVAALHAGGGRSGGAGSVIDASLYGSILRTLDWSLAAVPVMGCEPALRGNADRYVVPAAVVETADRRHVAVAASTADQWRALAHLIGTDALAGATAAERAAAAPEIYTALERWIADRQASVVLQELADRLVPAALARTARDIVADHGTNPDELVGVDDPRLGTTLQQAPYPRIDDTSWTPAGAPVLGASNEEVWCDVVGLSSQELADLRADGVV